MIACLLLCFLLAPALIEVEEKIQPTYVVCHLFHLIIFIIIIIFIFKVTHLLEACCKL